MTEWLIVAVSEGAGLLTEAVVYRGRRSDVVVALVSVSETCWFSLAAGQEL